MENVKLCGDPFLAAPTVSKHLGQYTNETIAGCLRTFEHKFIEDDAMQAKIRAHKNETVLDLLIEKYWETVQSKNDVKHKSGSSCLTVNNTLFEERIDKALHILSFAEMSDSSTGYALRLCKNSLLKQSDGYKEQMAMLVLCLVAQCSRQRFEQQAGVELFDWMESNQGRQELSDIICNQTDIKTYSELEFDMRGRVKYSEDNVLLMCGEINYGRVSNTKAVERIMLHLDVLEFLVRILLTEGPSEMREKAIGSKTTVSLKNVSWTRRGVYACLRDRGRKSKQSRMTFVEGDPSTSIEWIYI